MAFDGLTLYALTNEFNALLINGRIDKIYQPEKGEIILQIRQPGNNYKLVLSADPQSPRIHITEITKENPMSPPMFCMVLRKHLEGGRIRSFNQQGLERILNITIEAQDELGNYTYKTLLIEIMGKHSNVILLDSDGKTILDGIKRYSSNVSSHREVLPGREYIFPPLQNKLNVLDLPEDLFEKNLLSQPLDISIEKCILNILTGWSPESCKELIYRAGLDNQQSLEECGIIDLQKIWQELSKIVSSLKNNNFSPVWYKSTSGKPITFAPLPLHHIENTKDITALLGSMNEVVNSYYTYKLSAQDLNQHKQNILKVVNNELSKANKKINIYYDDIADADRREIYKVKGEILTANLFQLALGQTSVDLCNFYDPEGKNITIELDPHLSPNENAQRYFKLYAKGKSQRGAAEEQITKTQGEIDYLESVATAINNTENIKDLNEIRTELVEEGYLKGKHEKKKGFKGNRKKEKDTLAVEPIILSIDDIDVWVGKNNKQNDILTNKKANNYDLWFHVKDIPGSHVILRISTKGIKPEELKEENLQRTAQIAAFFSKARNSAQVPVDYTLVKHVYKPNGAKPGMVNYFEQRTIYVTPDESLISTLRKD
jgi:predicted ribosome quality control (RQC) complex YloA/Tae2 family protein